METNCKKKPIYSSTSKIYSSNSELNLIMSAVVFFFTILLFSGSTFAVDGVKWHPGHYFQLMAAAKTHHKYMMDGVYRDMANTPAIQGIQVRYYWGDLESSKGVYNFASIDKHLAEMAKRKKRLVIMIQTKSIGKSETYVPSYLRSAEYDGGVFAYSGYGGNTFKGENIKLWNPLVRDRFIQLFRALGARYNTSPYFEGIGMSETTPGDPLQPITSAQSSGYFQNLNQVLIEAKKAFSNTMVMQSVNYPRSIIAPLVDTLKKIGGGLSHPDTYLEEMGLLMPGTKYTAPGVYTYYPKLAGIIPLAPTVMHTNYRNTKSNGTGYEPTISQLNDFLKKDLKANYIFWTRDPKYDSKILEFLNWDEQKNTVAGGLSTNCPSTYTSCITE